MGKRISRREMLVSLAAAVGGGCMARSAAMEDLEPRAHLPLVSKMPSSTPTATATSKHIPTSTPTGTATATATATATVTGTPPLPPTGSRVVHVYSEAATFWNGQSSYWDYVDQGVVDEMVERGLKRLTGATTTRDAWQVLLPHYEVGQGIAVKLNFNNTNACTDADGQIDALVHPVNALARTLKQAGVDERDIWLYDATRVIPDRFVDECYHLGLQYYDRVCRNRAKFDSSVASAKVEFFPPPGVPTPPVTKVTDVLINATYLINVPVMKTHGYTGVTLSFKNHFGTIDHPEPLHDYVGLNWPYYRADYSPLVDLYRSPHIVGKTVLTIGDGLFAARDGTTAPPSPWVTFGNQAPNSLFLATDPVAMDCVMCDFLASETAVDQRSDDYLALASDSGLGVFERGDPWGSGYSHIDYLLIEL